MRSYETQPVAARHGRIPITRNLVLITGFRQRHGRATTGLDSLWHRLHSQLSGPDTAIWLRSWDDDFRALAAQINNYRLGRHVEIEIIAYSWGVGHGAVTLARELQLQGLSVNRLFSIDGVYKPWFPAPVRSLFSRWNPLAPQIVVPASVDTTVYWRQNRNRPQGHVLVSEGEGKVIAFDGDEGLIDWHTHQTIDVCEQVHNYIVERLGDQ